MTRPDSERPEERELGERYDEKQLAFLADQARVAAVPIFLSALVLAAVAGARAPLERVLFWLSLVVMVLVARRWLLARLSNSRRRPASQRLLRGALFSLVPGTIHGSAVLLFFPYLDTLGRAIVSMIMIGWAAGAVATNAGYLPSYLLYLVPMLAPLAAGWMLAGGPDVDVWQQRSLGALIVLFGLIQARFARVSQQMFRTAFQYEVELERLLKQAEQANAAKSRFLAAASHDLRQPIHSLALFGATLALRAPDSATQHLAAQMNSSIDSLGRLLDTLLDLSRLDAGLVKVTSVPTDLRPWLSELAASYRALAAQRGLTLETHLPASSLPASTDQRQLERVLRNLLDNALKYTDSGEIELGAIHRGATVEIWVRDTGCGIPASEQARVFDEFYQVGNPERDRRQGLGLGLAIVQRTAALLGARIELESEPGQGTTVRVSVPAASLPLPAPLAPPQAEPSDLKLEVLLVEDDPEVREATSQLLELWGWQVYGAGDSAEAVEIARARCPDVVLADLRLREHRSGIEAIALVRAECGPLPALLVSGEGDPVRLAAAQAAGLRVLHKPVAPDLLRTEILATVHAMPPPAGARS